MASLEIAIPSSQRGIDLGVLRPLRERITSFLKTPSLNSDARQEDLPWTVAARVAKPAKDLKLAIGLAGGLIFGTLAGVSIFNSGPRISDTLTMEAQSVSTKLSDKSSQLVQKSIAIPSRQTSVAKDYFQPGGLESNIQENVSFVDYNGTLNWVRAMVVSNPPIKELTINLSDKLIQHKERGERIALGDLLALGELEANKVIDKYSPDSSQVNRSMESRRSALIALSAITTFSNVDWQKIDNTKPTVDRGTYGEKNLTTIVFPRINGEDSPQAIAADKELLRRGHEVRYEGSDRLRHFIMHATAANEHKYSRYYNLQEHTLVPKLLRAWIALSGYNSIDDESLSFSTSAGIWYEFLGLLNKNNLAIPFFSKESAGEGILEDRVMEDLMTNFEGWRLGISLFDRSIDQRSVTDLYEALNDPSVAKRRTPALVQMIYRSVPQS